MREQIGLLGLVLAGILLSYAAPSRAAGEPVATAPIPPPAIAAPSPIPKSPHLVPAPAKHRVAKPTASRTTRSSARDERASTDRRKPARHDAVQASRRAELSKSTGRPAPERHPERPQAAVGREQIQQPSDYRPRRYYRDELVAQPEEPPFPPPWYDRGPPFAGMPYGPRGPMPPW